MKLHEMGSPPQNFRYYKFDDSPFEASQELQKINNEEHKAHLFKDFVDIKKSDQGSSIFEIKSNKPITSLRSTCKTQTNKKKQKSCHELKLNTKKNEENSKITSCKKSQSNKKSSILISQKESIRNSRKQSQKRSSVKLYPSSHIAKSSENRNWITNLKENAQEDNQFGELDDSFSQIFVKQINKTEQFKKSDQFGKKQYFYEMFVTLKQIRDIGKENVINQKKIMKILEEKNKLSTLYDKDDRDEKKVFKCKNTQRKSFKKLQEKSTIKKNIKNIILEQRVNKVEQKLKYLQKKIQDQSFLKKALLISRKKKSNSTLR